MDTRQIIGTESDFIESEGFANCETEAAKNFILYKQYGQQLKPDDRVKEIGLTMFSKEIRFDAPIGEVTFLWRDQIAHFCR